MRKTSHRQEKLSCPGVHTSESRMEQEQGSLWGGHSSLCGAPRASGPLDAPVLQEQALDGVQLPRGAFIPPTVSVPPPSVSQCPHSQAGEAVVPCPVFAGPCRCSVNLATHQKQTPGTQLRAPQSPQG